MTFRRWMFFVPLLLAVAMFVDAALGRGAFFHYDTWMQNYAFRAWWFDELRAGHFASWCSGMFSGYPLFAETQAGPLFPLTFLTFLVLPSTLAFSWSVILLVTLAGCGAMLLARRLGCSPGGALLAGVTYEFSGFLLAHVVHFNLLTGAALAPFAFAFAVGWLRRGSPLDFLGLAAIVASFFLGSHPYAYLMTLAGCAIFLPFAFEGRPGSGQAVGRVAGVALAWVVGAGLAAIQLFPSIDFLPRTPRSGAVDPTFLTFGSFPPQNLATLWNPNLWGSPATGTYFGDLDWSHFAETCSYVGLLPLALAVVALVLRPNRVVGGLFVLCCLAYLFMLGNLTPLYEVIARIPVYQSTRLPARWALLFTLGIAQLAGLGWTALGAEANSARRNRAVLGAGAALVLLALFALFVGREALLPSAGFLGGGGRWAALVEGIHQEARVQWIRSALVAGAALFLLGGAARSARPASPRFTFAALALIAVDLWSFGKDLNPRIDPQALKAEPPVVSLLRPQQDRARIMRQGVDEMWERVPGAPRTDLMTPGWKGNEATYATGAWTLPPNCQLLYGVDSCEGFTSLPPKQWLEWMGVPTHSGASWRPNLSEAQADLLAIDAVISTGSGIGGPGWTAEKSTGDVWVSHNTDPLPRARLYRNWRVLSRPEILRTLSDSSYNPRVETLLEEPFEAGGSFAASSPAAKGEPTLADSSAAAGETVLADSTLAQGVSLREISPGEFQVSLPRGRNGVVVVAESFDPHWTAVDARGTALPLRRADGLFLAFFTDGSSEEVHLRYAPKPLRTGALVSAFSGFGVLAFGGFWAARKKKQRPGSEKAPATINGEKQKPQASVAADRPASRDADKRKARSPWATAAEEGLASPGLGSLHPKWVLVPATAAALFLGVGFLVHRTEWNAAWARTSLQEAAVRVWSTDAEGAYRAGAFPAALELLQRAIAVSPQKAELHFQAGLVYRGLRRSPEAVTSFKEALRLDPKFEAAKRALEESLRAPSALEQTMRAPLAPEETRPAPLTPQ